MIWRTILEACADFRFLFNSIFLLVTYSQQNVIQIVILWSRNLLFHAMILLLFNTPLPSTSFDSETPSSQLVVPLILPFYSSLPCLSSIMESFVILTSLLTHKSKPLHLRLTSQYKCSMIYIFSILGKVIWSSFLLSFMNS